MTKINLMHSDSPISNREEDAFQRYPFANRVASVIKGHSGTDSFVVGIYGKWGEGKSSVLNFIKDDLKVDDNTIIIDFNPWLFANEDQLLLSFFNVLAIGIDKPLKSRKEKVGKTLLDYADAIGTIGSLIGLSGGERILQYFGKKLSQISIDEYKNRVNKSLEDAGKKVLVVIDDIDRLSISEVQIIFRLIKLVADFKNTVYLLSFDDELVATALDSTYSKGGYDYLEKIIQLPLRLPKAQYSAVRKYSLSSIFESLNIHEISLNQEELQRFVLAFDKHFLKLIVTPRIVVRFANSISFSIPLLKGEVNMVDLLMIEGVKVTFPHLYSYIRSNQSLFVKNYGSYSRIDRDDYKERDEAKAVIEKYLDRYSSELKLRLNKLLIEIFPQLDVVFGNSSFSDDTNRQWYEKKRICSRRYFERYFSYVVLEGEISDVVFDGIMDQINTKDFYDKREELIQLFSDLDKAELALKIQFLEDSFTPIQKRYLSLNLCLVGGVFPVRDSGGFTIMAPFQQMAYFIQKCVADQDSENRVELGVKLVDRTMPLNFAFEIWRALHPRRDGGSRPEVLPERDFKDVSKTLYLRCRHELSLDQLYESLEDSSFRYLLGIGSEENPDGIKQEIEDWLETNKDNFLKLLYAFSQTTHSHSGEKEGGKTYKSNFSQAFYDLLKKVVDIDFFYFISIELFGDKSDFEPTSDRDELMDEQLVGWFQRVHLKKETGELNSDDISTEE